MVIEMYSSFIGIAFEIFCIFKFVEIAEQKGYYQFTTPMWALALAGFVLTIVKCILLAVLKKYYYLDNIIKLALIVNILLVIIGILTWVLSNVIIVIEDKNNIYEKSKYPKSRTIDTLYCMYLGGLGIHLFYEGKIKSGIIRIVSGPCHKFCVNGRG